MNAHPSSLWLNTLFQLNKYVFFASSICLFLALGTYKNIYVFLYIAACTSFLGICLAWRKAQYPKLPLTLFLPIMLSIYIIVSPALFFNDVRVGSLFLASYIVGAGAVIFFRNRLYLLPFCLLGVISLSFIVWILWRPESFVLEGTRLRLLFNAATILAPFCIWGIVFLLSTWRTIPRCYVPLGVLCIVCAAIACALATSRASFIGLTLVVFFCAFYLFQKHLVKICLLACLLAVVSYAILPEHQQTRIISALTAPLQDPTFQSRMPIWQGALVGIKQAPWVGHTHKRFKPFFSEYRKQNHTELTQLYPLMESSEQPHPHNIVLWLLFSWGIIGTTLTVISFGATTLVALRSKNSFFLLTLIFFLGYGIFDSPLHNKVSILILFTQGTVAGAMLQNILKLPEKTI